MKYYNVYIINITTGKAVRRIGHLLSLAKAEKRVMTGLMRINDGFYTAEFLVGSEQDTKLKNDLIK